MNTRSQMAVAALILGASLPACYASTEVAVGAEVGASDEAYSPAYYEGTVVYYDESGTPFVYVDHEVRYVPRDNPQYDVLVSHYRKHGRAYQAWYRTHGFQEPEPRTPNFHEHHRGQ